MATDEVEITDRDGWRKTFPLTKPLIYIGSDPRNDIVLDRTRGGGVAPRHLQLLSIPGQGLRLINLGDTEIFLGPRPTDALPPRGTVVLAAEATLSVGEFTLVLRYQGGEGRSKVSPVSSSSASRSGATPAIGVELALPQTQLVPGQVVEGAVTVRNLGAKAGVQFKLDVEGVPPECYELGPAPLLFPNAAKTVPLRLWHPQQATPAAGSYRLVLRASAPEEYPGEVATVSREIQIAPYYAHTVTLVPVTRR